MALYEELMAVDVLGPIMEQLAKKIIWLDEEEWKLRYDVNLLAGSPWLNARYAKDRDCMAWTFYFNTYGIIPKGCRRCWKIATKMETLRQLLEMMRLQERMDLPSKCGYEDEADRWPSR